MADTPRKTCVLGDVCIVCGFSFLVLEKSADGKENVHKHYENKLKLNTERIQSIRNVTQVSVELEGASKYNAGVCRKCFRQVESVIKAEEKNNVTKQKLKEGVESVYRTQVMQLPSPRRKNITKRMLSSPGASKPDNRPTKMHVLASVTYVSPVKISPFKEITGQRQNERQHLQGQQVTAMESLECISVNIKDHFEEVTGIRKRKGFHHLPSYKTDVLKVVKELTDQNVLTINHQRRLDCKTLNPDRDLYSSAYKGLCTMIHRHKPSAPFRRLRDPHV